MALAHAKPTYQELEDEVEFLRSEIERMTVDMPLAFRLRHRLNLTPKEADILVLLFKRQEVTKAVLYEAVFEYDNGDGPIWKIIDVYICKLRKKLREAGAPGNIKTLWGHGVQLEQSCKDWIRGLAL